MPGQHRDWRLDGCDGRVTGLIHILWKVACWVKLWLRATTWCFWRNQPHNPATPENLDGASRGSQKHFFEKFLKWLFLRVKIARFKEVVQINLRCFYRKDYE